MEDYGDKAQDARDTQADTDARNQATSQDQDPLQTQQQDQTASSAIQTPSQQTQAPRPAGMTSIPSASSAPAPTPGGGIPFMPGTREQSFEEIYGAPENFLEIEVLRDPVLLLPSLLSTATNTQPRRTIHTGLTQHR